MIPPITYVGRCNIEVPQVHFGHFFHQPQICRYILLGSLQLVWLQSQYKVIEYLSQKTFSVARWNVVQIHNASILCLLVIY